MLLKRGWKADMKTYNALLPALLTEAPAFLQQEAVEAFLADLGRRGLAPDKVTFNTIIKHYAGQVCRYVGMCGDIRTCTRAYMYNVHVHPDTYLTTHIDQTNTYTLPPTSQSIYRATRTRLWPC